MTTSYRAAYLLSSDKQAELVLTAPEHAEMSDDELRAEALAEAERAGVNIGDGTIEIGTWTQR